MINKLGQFPAFEFFFSLLGIPLYCCLQEKLVSLFFDFVLPNLHGLRRKTDLSVLRNVIYSSNPLILLQEGKALLLE